MKKPTKTSSSQSKTTTEAINQHKSLAMGKGLQAAPKGKPTAKP